MALETAQGSADPRAEKGCCDRAMDSCTVVEEWRRSQEGSFIPSHEKSCKLVVLLP